MYRVSSLRICVVRRSYRHSHHQLALKRMSSSQADDGVPYDMVIAGGGMVGTALACCIGQEPALAARRVLVLEPTKSVPPRTTADEPYSNRVCAISQGSAKLLNSIGAWNDVIEMRAKPFQRMHVWDSCSSAFITFSPQSDLSITPESLGSLGLDETDDLLTTSPDIMGHIVENRVLLHALNGSLERCSGVEVRRGVAVDDITMTSDGPNPDPWVGVSLSDGSQINTRLLVGADGSSSKVRKLAGISEVSWQYSQSAVVATLHLEEESTNTVAWQRFLPSGPIALLPLSDSVSSLVWSTSPSHAKQLLEMDSERFIDAVNAALFDEYPQDEMVQSVNNLVRNFLTSAMPGGSSLPVRQLPPVVKGLADDSRGGFPLSFVHTPFYTKPRIVLVGDAAHRIHPLAGLGVNLGFGDVGCLHQVLLKAASRGEEWGTLSSLKEYESSRQWHNIPVMATINGLQRLFSTSWTPLVMLRSVGLQLVGALYPVKDFIISQAQKAN